MSTKKEDQKLLTEKVKPTEQLNQVKQPTVEELQKTVEELQKKLLSSPQSLEEKIKYLQVKQQLVKKLNLLNLYQNNVNEFIHAINEEAETDILTTENFYVEFHAKETGRYSTKEVLKIQNPSVVLELFKFASDKIGEQITVTENQIND